MSATHHAVSPRLRPQQRFYRPELDVLRFFAFLAVFVLHSSIFPTGWLADLRLSGAFGLPLFFFLSAFLITELLDREQETTGTIRLGAFYMRRILRIWPLYFAALLFDFIHAQLHAPVAFTGRQLATYLLLVGNWYIAKHGFTGSLTMPLWSISVEEQFYVLWPSVRRLWSRRVAIGLTILTLALALVAIAYESHQSSATETAIWVNSFVQFQFFASGALVALLLRHRIPQIPAWARWLLFTFGCGAMFCAQSVFHVKSVAPRAELGQLISGYLLVNLSCVAIFFSFAGAAQLSRARPLIYLGKISYGLYVFHYPVLALASKAVTGPGKHMSVATYFGLRAAVALPCTVVLAHFSYKYFEAPILRYKQRFEVIRTRPVEP